MEIGVTLIQVKDGVAQVVRCEEDGAGTRLVPAVNAAELADQAAQAVVAGFNRPLDQDGLYLCTEQLQATAAFPSLPLPADAIGSGEAGSLLWPEASRGERWERLKALRDAGAVRVYRVGRGEGTRRFVAWGTVARLVGRDPAQRA